MTIKDIRLQPLEDVFKEGEISRRFGTGTITQWKKGIYIPERREGETNTSYDARANLTPFENKLPLMIDAITGSIFKNALIIPETITKQLPFLDNIDLRGNTLEVYLKKSINRSLVNGIDFSFVKYSSKLNRPYVENELYENLLNFRIEDEETTRLIFQKKVLVPDEDGEGSKVEQAKIIYNEEGYQIMLGTKKEAIIPYEKKGSNVSIPFVDFNTGKPYEIIENRFLTIPFFVEFAMLTHCLLQINTSVAQYIYIANHPILKTWDLDMPTKDVKNSDGSKSKITKIEFGKIINFGISTGLQRGDAIWEEVKGACLENSLKVADSIKTDLDKRMGNFMQPSNSSKTRIEAKDVSNKGDSNIHSITAETESKGNELLMHLLNASGNFTLFEDKKNRMTIDLQSKF